MTMVNQTVLPKHYLSLCLSLYLFLSLSLYLSLYLSLSVSLSLVHSQNRCPPPGPAYRLLLSEAHAPDTLLPHHSLHMIGVEQYLAFGTLFSELTMVDN